jgi:hypothetical protein
MSKVYGICSTEANVGSICADIINNQQPSKACMRSEEDTKKRAAVDTIHMAITGHLDWTTATYSSTCTVDHDEVARGSLSESSVAKLLLSIVVDFFKDFDFSAHIFEASSIPTNPQQKEQHNTALSKMTGLSCPLKIRQNEERVSTTLLPMLESG